LKIHERVVDFIATAFLILAGLLGMTVSVLDFIGTDLSSGPWSWVKAPEDLVLLTIGIIAISLGLERTLRFQKMNDKLDKIQQEIEIVTHEHKVELVSERKRLYEAALDAASEGTPSNPIRRVKIYAPLGFTSVDQDKQKWLEGLKKLVLEHRVTQVDAIYGLPQDKTNLAKAANFLMYFFFHSDLPQNSKHLQNHIFVRGVELGGSGLGVPRGFGILIIEGKLLLIGYSMARGDQIVNGAILTRNQKAIQDMSDWFDGHVYGGGGLKELQDYVKGEQIVLSERLLEILSNAQVPKDLIDLALKPKIISYEDINKKLNG